MRETMTLKDINLHLPGATQIDRPASTRSLRVKRTKESFLDPHFLDKKREKQRIFTVRSTKKVNIENVEEESPYYVNDKVRSKLAEQSEKSYLQLY